MNELLPCRECGGTFTYHRNSDKKYATWQHVCRTGGTIVVGDNDTAIDQYNAFALRVIKQKKWRELRDRLGCTNE